jgi:hypothetical protein
MKSHLKVEMTVATLRAMTAEQLKSLQDNVLADGQWETFQPATEVLHIDGGEYLGVYLDHGFFLGIEKDGHAHS